MAATKKTKHQTMDVARPENTSPDTSSRPLIVGNRSMIPDPMMVAVDQTSTEPTTSPLLVDHTRQVKPSETPVGLDTEHHKTQILDETAAKKPRQPLVSIHPVVVKPPSHSPKENTEQTTPEKPADMPAVAEEDDADNSGKETDKKSSEKNDEKIDEKAAEAEQAEHMQELIDAKTYFVPIHRHGKQGSGWLFFLVILIAAVAGAIMYMVTTLQK